MKRLKIIVGGILTGVIALAFIACWQPIDERPIPCLSWPQDGPGTLPFLNLSIAPFERGGNGALHRYDWRHTTVSLSNVGAYKYFAFDEVNAEARGRGNSSWHAMGNKRPLRIRFPSGQERSMFGSTYTVRDWTLIANAVDHSLMRNHSAYFLGSLLSGMDFSPARHFVHLFMDGEYRGVYMLSDQMEAGRLGLVSNTTPALSEYFLEWCHRVPSENPGLRGDVYFLLNNSIPFEIRFPGGSIRRNGGNQFVNEFVHEVDRALMRGNREEMSALIDIPSFVDFYLVQELFKNRDVGFSSLFFQVRQINGNPKLFAGPLWDFDLSSGSSRLQDSHGPSPQGVWATTQNRFFRLLMDTGWFREKVSIRWSEIRNREVQTMIGEIRCLADAYQACFEHNFMRWPDKRVRWTNPNLFQLSFMVQVEFLIGWFEQRKRWMDSFLQ
ncbi:MAG: CotH kinase family protein [Treponema sp.]|nr:CotH kinase family protein [Treponema sp.]